MNQSPAIVLLGPTGSGKTPLGQLIERRGLWGMACRHFDFGQRLRAVAVRPPRYLTAAQVKVVRAALRSGALLEDGQFAIARKILRAFLAPGARGADSLIVLNGLPRHVGQARALEATLDVRAVIELRCSPQVVLHRIKGNVGGDRAGRKDDAPQAVKRRTALYRRRTAAVLEHYRRLGAVIETLHVGLDTGADDLWRRLNASAPHIMRPGRDPC